MEGCLLEEFGDGMQVHTVPVHTDNYSYLIVHAPTKEAMAVDPAEAEKVLAYAQKIGVSVKKVLTTHKHWDHAGGNAKMLELIPDLEIVGGKLEQVTACNRFVEDGEELAFHSIKVKALLAPCHTSGHVLFLVSAAKGEGGEEVPPALFSGDTLFIGGCGRFFEGNAELMMHVVDGVLSRLPDDTRIFCGHEYTKKNLQFAVMVEGEGSEAAKKLKWAEEKLEQNQPTVPSLLKEERTFNVFLRIRESSVQRACGTSTAVETMGKLRQLKDNF
mmetsp:Transcript_49122/g.96851  ORF Transcript_49122/g.96851 Transcript_49122/m.96851 type:complete len:273 (+) Transcript_49122:195-1013(+)